MSGIAGWADFRRNMSLEFNSVHKMIEGLEHRGRSGSGYWKSENVVLGVRLAGLFPNTSGMQPMVRTINGRTCTAVFNGELYNHKELRGILLSKGTVFQTNSDTEVLLLAYMEWGEDCVDRFSGMFSFVIWDEYREYDGRITNEKMLVVRDPLGIKPLFYALKDGGVIFASELPALIRNRLIEPKLTKEGLSEILIMSPMRTIWAEVFEGVKELCPGHMLIYTKDGLKDKCYKTLVVKEHGDNFEQTVEKIREMFIDNVKLQTDIDYPVACLLSGGLDSGGISAVTAKERSFNRDCPLSTFEIDFSGNDVYFKKGDYQPDPDSPYARITSDFIGSNHTIITTDNKEMADSIREALRYRGYPGMGDIDASLLLAFRKINERFKVVMSGEGADEVFGGYPWLHKKELMDSQTFPWMTRIAEKLRLLNGEVSEFTEPEVYINRRYEETKAMTPIPERMSEEDKRRAEISYMNLFWFAQNLLERKDRMSSAAGVEARLPFVDFDILQYVWNIPWEYKAYGGREKGLLRKAMEGILPQEIIYRKKSPYPKTYNPIYEQYIKSSVQEILGESNGEIWRYINPAAVRKIIEESSDYSIPWFGQLMSRPQLFAWLIQLDEWLKYTKASF